jgi:hypothetical protein
MIVAAFLAMSVSGYWNANLHAKGKKNQVDPNDVTYRLFQLLDDSKGGKLDDLYVLGDTYQDPSKPGEELVHIFKVEYNKSSVFGKLRIYVRSVAKMTPQQLSTYTLQQIFDFGETDMEKFVKTEPGEFGKTGDLYLRPNPNGTLETAPVTDETRKHYETYVSQYILPALQKK